MRPFRPDTTCPLDGLRVLDLSRLVAGNMLSLQLADFGAEVIKIEDPRKGDPLRDWRVKDVSVHWKVYARNKKSVTLNLRAPEGLELLRKLATTASVFIENFRPGTLEEMGIGPDALHALNPKLIVVRVSGWGQDGPYRDKPGFGSLVEGMSTFAAKNGYADRPPVLPPLALADMVAGLYGANAVLVALRAIEHGGTGQVIDLPLLDPIFSVLGPEAAIYRLTQTIEPRVGSRSHNTAPRNVYETKDGRFISISASIQTMAERLFRAIGRADMIDDPRFRTNTDRVRNIDECDRVVADFIKARTLGRRTCGVRGRGSDRRAGLRDRPVHRRPACAGARNRHRAAGRRDGQHTDACGGAAIVRHAGRDPHAGAGARRTQWRNSRRPRFQRRCHRRSAQQEGHMSERKLPVWRSALYVPANVPRFIDGAHRRGADAIIVDLEDSVPIAERPAARRDLIATAENVARGGADVIVRINRPWRQAMLDLEAAINPRRDGARRHQGEQRRITSGLSAKS